MSGTSALLIKRQMKFKKAISINIAATIIAFLLYLEHVLKSEAYGSYLHLFIILMSLINCFKSYKSMKSYEAFYEQMIDQYKTEMQNAEDFKDVLPEFKEFMKLNNEEPELKTWNSEMNTPISVICLALLGTYALAKIFQDYLLHYYNMINNIWLYISFLITMGYLIFDDQNIAECMNQDIRNFKERMKKYTSKNFSNFLDVKSEIRKQSCHGDASSKVLQNSSKITREIIPEEKTHFYISDKSTNHENENCYISQETTHNKGETKNLNLNTSDSRVHQAETNITEKEETAGKSDNNLHNEQECRLQLIANMTEKEIHSEAFNQDHNMKEMKQNEEQWNSVPKENILKQRENNNGELNSSDLNIDEVEGNIAGKEKIPVKASDNLQGMDGKKNRSETILNGTGKVAEKDINVGVSTQDYSEKDIKRTEEQATLVPNDNINEQRESNNGKANPLDPCTNETKTDVAGKAQTLRKVLNKIQGMNEQECSSEVTVSVTGRDYEKDVDEAASNQSRNKKDNKRNEAQENASFDENIIQPKESNKVQSSPPDCCADKSETDSAKKDEMSRKTYCNITLRAEEYCPSESIADVRKDSEKDIRSVATNQDQTEKDIKQDDEQRNSVPNNIIIEQRKNNNWESSSTELNTDEDERKIAGEEETPIEADGNLQGIDENKNRPETIANGTEKDSEKDINVGASSQDHSDKYIKQSKERGTFVPDDNIDEQRESNNMESRASDPSRNEGEIHVSGKQETLRKAHNNVRGINEQKCSSEAIVNVTGRDSEKHVDTWPSNQGREEKDSQKYGTLKNSFSDENIIEPKETNKVQPSTSDRCTDIVETNSTGKEEISRNTHCNITLRGEENCQSESITDVRNDSEKHVRPVASSEDHTEKDIKQNDEKRNSVHNNVIFEQKENNNGESRSSDFNTDEAERKIARKEKTPIKADGYLQGMDEKKKRSKTILNETGKDSEKDINVGASSPDHSDKDIKQSEEQETFVPDYNINEQRESNNMVSRASDPNRNEGETDVAGKEETLKKTHNNIQGMNQQECSSEAIVNVTGRDSEKDVDKGASNQGCEEKDSEQNGAQENLISGQNMIEPIETYIVQSSPSDLCIMKSETDIVGKEEISRKAHCNITVTDEENSPSESIVDVRKDSEKDIRPITSSQYHAEKDIKQNDGQRNSVHNNIIFEQRENNNGESSSSDPDEAERNIAGEEETPIEADGNLQGMDENKNRSETSANGTGKDSEKDINLGALTQVHSEKEAKQTKEQETLVPNDNINEQTESNNGKGGPSDPSINEVETDVAANEKTLRRAHSNIQDENEQKCSSEAIVNVTARNSEKGVDEVASNQGRNEEYRKQNGAQENSISDENIFEPKESNNIQSSPSDRCTDTPETDSIGNEEIPRKVHCNKTLRGEEKCQSESIADIRTDSGKDILPFASSQDHTEKDIKQNDGQTNSVHNNIIFEQRENNNGESSSSDLNTDEAERKIAGKEETLVKANGNLQGMDENKNRSETIANGTGEYFEKDINVGASSPDHSDKDIKISEEQENFVPDYNINEQRESNNMESRASHPSRNEGETHVSGKEETLRKTHNNVRGMVEQECSSEAIVNVTGRDSEKKVEECASNRGHNEKDNKRNGAQENSFCDENMIQPKESEKDIRPVAFSQDQAEKDIKQTDEQGNFVPINIIIEERESNNGKSSSSDINTDEAERIISGKEKTPKKAEGNLQGMDEKKNRSATILNMTEKDAEKDINVGASTQDHSEERIKQTEEQGTRDSEQNGAQENSISGENMIESIESYIVQSSPSDLCIMKSETDGAGKEELSRKAHCNITVRYEENCPSESIVDVRKVSEKALRPAASSEGHTEKDIKQNDEQGNSVPNNIRIEQRKNNYGESSSSELDTDESERNIAGKEETLIKADGNLQGINAKTNRSETILNGVGKVSEKDMNVGVSTQDYSEKDIKQTEKRGILVPDGNINEQRESNKSELSASDPNTNEAERDDAGEEKTSMKIDENPQKKVQKERSETNANGVGKCSENDINLGVSTQEHCEKDIKQTVDHRNLIPDDNIIAKIECKNRELGSSDPISNEAERDVAEEEKISIKIDENIQGMDEKTNRSETLANGAGKDSKKVINLGASPQDQREKDIKQNEEQGNLGPDDNIIEQRESINSESSLSDPSTNVHIIEPKQCDNGESRPSTNEAKENFEGKEKASEKGVKSLKETEMKENPLFCHSVHMRKIFRKKYPPKERNFDSKRNFRRALKDKKCERDILLVSGTEACKRAVELNMCSAYCAGASKSTEAQLESDTSNQMSSEIEKNIHVENVQIKSENEKCSPAQQCIFEQEGNTDTEKHLPKSFHSSPCRKRDFQQHINVTVSVNIIKKFMPSVCEEKDSEENEVTEVKRISVDKHISNMGEDMPSLYAEDTTERKRISDSVLNMGGVKADSDINVDVSNTDDQQCERNLIKYEWKSDQLDQSASNTKEVSEASGSQDMQTKGMSEQFMESFPIEHDKKKENTCEESTFWNRIASKMEADIVKRDDIGVKAEISKVFIPSLVTGKCTQRNNTNENHKIALDQNRMQTLEGLQKDIFPKLNQSGRRAIGTECDQGIDGKGDKQSLSIEEAIKLNMVEDSRSVFAGEVTENKQLLVNERNIEITTSTEKSNRDGTQRFFVAETLEDIMSSNSFQCTNTMKEYSERKADLAHEKANKAECTSKTKSSSSEERKSCVKEALKRICGSDTAEDERYENDAKYFSETSVKREDTNRNKSNSSNMSAINIKEIKEQTYSLVMSDDIKQEADVKLISVEESSSETKKSEFNSNPSDQNMKCTDSEGEISSSASMRRISEKNIEIIRAERRRKKKETSEEVTFSNYAVSNVDKSLKARESIDNECASKQSMHQIVREDKKKYETKEINVGGEVAHKDVTKKKKSTNSKRDNIVRNHKEKGYQRSLTNEVCHHHHERRVHLSNCCDSVNGNQLRIDKGKSLLTERNVPRYEANLSMQGGITTTESTPTKDNYLKHNNEHHMVRSDCQRRRDRKNCTVVLQNETLHLTFKTSKSFKIRCKLRPTCVKVRSQEIG